MSEHYIERKNLSLAWEVASTVATSGGRSEILPLVVSITGFDEKGAPIEDERIRKSLDRMLLARGNQSVETVASTIFPQHMWNPSASREQLFERYRKILPRLKEHQKNRYGIYFERMIDGGPDQNKNQLDFVIGAYQSRDDVRRSMLQVAIFNPTKDLSLAAQRGFPCLQHVTFAPSGDNLTVNAFYATQYLFERAYGNYLGLCRLGQFAAHEMGLRLDRVTCYTGIAKYDGSKTDLREILSKQLSLQTEGDL